MQLDIVDLHPLIGGQILAFEVGVDRHLKLSASTDRGDEVDGHDPALPADQGYGFGSDVKLHRCTHDRGTSDYPREWLDQSVRYAHHPMSGVASVVWVNEHGIVGRVAWLFDQLQGCDALLELCKNRVCFG